ncbi:MAG TPA: sugar ABC transporter ATP-binding protein [bacterium]|nr:sugar ABC transporter ATP-binding protein [bacterium]
MAQPGMTATDQIQPELQMVDIAKRFGATVALQGVNFDVFPGEVHALVGENGAGKSTLMKVLSGAYTPDEGVMFLDQELFEPRNPLDARRKGVGMIYQELSLAPHLTVQENILLGMEPSSMGFIRWKEVRKRAAAAIEPFEHPEIQPETRVADLSVSAQQLVEIGRSLAVGCEVLVFDEPTSSLSRNDIQRLFSIIRGLREQGLAIVYISHFLEEVQQVADRLTVLRDGAVVGTKLVDEVTSDEIIEMMVGRKVDDLYPRSVRRQGEPILHIRNLAGMQKPAAVNLTLHRGEVLGIAGLVGAGRTEFLRVVFGLDPIRSGAIRLGAFAGPASPVRRWAQGMGLLSENRKEEGLALGLSVMDNVTLSNLRALQSFGLVLPSDQHDATRHWIQQLDIRCQRPEQKVNKLSGGNQQKTALARLLHHDVDVMLLDEPTKGIDVPSKAKIYQVIDDFASGRKGHTPKAVLMVSSYLPELLGVCDRLAVMHRGTLSKAKPVEEVDEHEIMLAATGRGELT